jgi:hypothetical protein
MGVLHVVHKNKQYKNNQLFSKQCKNYPNAPLLIGLMKSKSSISGAYNEE